MKTQSILYLLFLGFSIISCSRVQDSDSIIKFENLPIDCPLPEGYINSTVTEYLELMKTRDSERYEEIKGHFNSMKTIYEDYTILQDTNQFNDYLIIVQVESAKPSSQALNYMDFEARQSLEQQYLEYESEIIEDELQFIETNTMDILALRYKVVIPEMEYIQYHHTYIFTYGGQTFMITGTSEKIVDVLKTIKNCT
ncbi:MAG: hypothetical protein Salg2KO_03630 [Salibacteraceae bacterium]